MIVRGSKMFSIFSGDCARVMSSWPDECIDSLVTDPPAGVGFMNKSWDSDLGGRDQWIAWLTSVSTQMFRLMKPGAWGFVWALPRTSHWTATGLENAGFEIRDINHHLNGTGFPKGTNQATIPTEWSGWNTALKPAAEHWILIRKPAVGTLAENLGTYGVGAMNIEGCSIGGPEGRWPANVTLSESGAAELDLQTMHLRPGGKLQGGEGGERNLVSPLSLGPREAWEPYGDSGGASRFFYIAKPGRTEKENGCDFIPYKTPGEATGGRKEGSAGLNNPRAGAGRTSGARNHHPTVKSIALMRYLTRLVTPPEGVVLDPFMGSGTTGVAALEEGFSFVGIEKEFEYLAIANARLSTVTLEP